MRILIIDDSNTKIESLRALLSKRNDVKDIRVAKSYQSGKKTIAEFGPDLLLLDMTLPTSESADGATEGRMRLYGGREIMAEMDFDGVECCVIIVTQYDNFPRPGGFTSLNELLGELKEEFPKLFAGGIYYSHVNLLWSIELTRLIDKLQRSGRL